MLSPTEKALLKLRIDDAVRRRERKSLSREAGVLPEDGIERTFATVFADYEPPVVGEEPGSWMPQCAIPRVWHGLRLRRGGR